MDYFKKAAKKILRWQAERVLVKYNPKIIAVVGAVGKTITKETIYGVLSKKVYIRKSEKSFTTEVGVPLTVLGSASGVSDFFGVMRAIFSGFSLIIKKQKYPDWLLLELDSDKPGDLETVSTWIKPDILVLTAIGEVPSHIESFGDIESFVNEKGYIVDSVKREGVIVYNSDDYLVTKLVNSTKVRKISCGTIPPTSILGKDYSPQYLSDDNGILNGMEFNFLYRKKEYKVVRVGQIGVHIEYASLLAFAVGHEFGLPSKSIVSAIEKVKVVNGRSRIIKGIKSSTIIDDTYNASPIATQEFIKIAGKISASNRKVIVLGDMLELGQHTAIEHRKLAEVMKLNADYVVTVGFRMKKMAEELLGLGFPESNIVSFDSTEEVLSVMDSIIQEGDIVLVKGSQDMRLERVVEEIMHSPENKEKVLVRQEKEWTIK